MVDEDLKETGNGFTFTTHFALGLTFGRGSRCVPFLRSAAVAAAIHGGSQMNKEQAQSATLAG